VAPVGFAVPLTAFAIPVYLIGERSEYSWFLAVVAGGLLLWLELRILRGVGIAWTTPVALTLWIVTALVVLLFHKEPGVVLGMLFLTLGLRRGRMTLAGLAVLCLIGFFSHYYYTLSLTLLTKSLILMAAGGLLLGARPLLRRLSPPGQPAATPTGPPGPEPEPMAPGGIPIEPEEASS
jgi:hypothetical protein